MHFLPSSRTSKEEVARKIVDKDGIIAGRGCLIGAFEPCMAFDVQSNRDGARLQMVARPRKYLPCSTGPHGRLYSYQIHPKFGWIHARIQTGFPFAFQIYINIYINAREWLTRQLDAEGVAYQRKGNCICWVEDFAKRRVGVSSFL